MGAKNVENRTWTTNYRGQLAIHAASAISKSGTADARVAHTLCTSPTLYNTQLSFSAGYPLVVHPCCGSHEGSECEKWGDIGPWTRDDTGKQSSPTIYHWMLENVRALAIPVDCKGRLGLWTLDTDAAFELHHALNASEPVK
jgi:hypothetical protein